MTDTPYELRSYGGGSNPAQLVEAIGASDLSFTISTTVGWTETSGPNVGQPLGTSGPFVVCGDRFTASVEKMNCTAVNLSTGVVTVQAGGRGFDGTTAQAHVPGGSSSGFQPVWSSVEAYEANKAVSYVLGTAGGTRTAGHFMGLDGSGNPQWNSVAGVQSVSLFGVGPAPVGSPPARLTGAFFMQAGTDAKTFASGFFAYTWPQSFPNGFLGAYFAVEDTSPGSASILTFYDPSQVGCELTANVAGTAYSGVLTFSFLAIGF